jgi:hypothetical protein
MIYVLVTLSVLLAISFSVVSVNESQTRSAISTDESVVAFFLAESGAEIFLDRIYSGTYDAGALSSLYTNCSNGIFTNALSSGTWTASFFADDGTQLTSCSSTSWRTEVNEMKIDGNHSNTIRSIRMSIEPPVSSGGGSVPTYVRSNDDVDDSVTLDIGDASTDRLVAVFGSVEQGNNALSGVTVDGKDCHLVEDAYNRGVLNLQKGARTELWYCDEDDLGSSSGTVTVNLGGASASWAIHTLLFTGISQDGPADSGFDEASSGTTRTITGMDVSENGIVVMGATNGGTGTANSWTSPLDQKTDADPNSAKSYSAAAIETTAQTNKSYQVTWSGSTTLPSAVAASWDPAD